MGEYFQMVQATTAGFFFMRNDRGEQAIIDRNSIPVTECGCWWWTGGVDRKGYGSFSVAGVPVRAHRLAWVLYKGPIPHGLFVLHICDVPCCVNPDHLRLGTHQDNMDDMVSRGRSSTKRLARNYDKRRFSVDIQNEIRNLTESQRSLSRRLGISQSTISLYRRRFAREHLSSRHRDHPED